MTEGAPEGRAPHAGATPAKGARSFIFGNKQRVVTRGHEYIATADTPSRARRIRNALNAAKPGHGSEIRGPFFLEGDLYISRDGANICEARSPALARRICKALNAYDPGPSGR